MIALPAMLLIAALVAACGLVVWLIVKHPILSIPIAVYIALHAWLGAHDAQALAIYALIALAIWRRAHKHPSQRLNNQPPPSPPQQPWTHAPPPAHDQHPTTPNQAPTHPEDPTDRIHTTA